MRRDAKQLRLDFRGSNHDRCAESTGSESGLSHFKRVHPARLIPVVVSLLVFTGCGGQEPPATDSPSKSPSASAGEPSSADATASTGSSGQKNPGQNANGGATSQPSNTGAAGGPGAANGAKAARAKPLAAPTPQQIAKWAIRDFQPLQLLACYDGFSDSIVQSLAVSPDGKQFALAGAKLSLWGITESQPSIDLVADSHGDKIERPIRSVAISPDGQWLAAGDQKGMLRIFNLSDRTEAVAVRAHEGRLTQLAFTPNSQILATSSYSGEVTLWQLPDAKKIKSLKISDQEIARLVFLTDQQLAVAGQEAALWNIESGTKESVLSTGYVRGPSLGLSSDRQRLAFGDADAKVQLWDVDQAALSAGSPLHGGAALIEFSHDGKWIATYSPDATIRIWDGAIRQIVQVIDANGGRTADFKWLPQAPLLLVASEQGRVHTWGTPESAQLVGLQPMQLPALGAVSTDSRKPFSSARLLQVIDIRSFPQPPGAVEQWSQAGMTAFKTPITIQEGELFYRYYLGKAGWKETTAAEQAGQGMEFRKDGCVLNVSLTAGAATTAGGSGELQVNLNLAGRYDVRWLPKVSEIVSKSAWSSLSSVSYRTKMDMTDVEVGLLKQFHDAGWTAYSRLAASSVEEPASRTWTMLQRGSQLTVTIGHPANEPQELAVQTSVSILNKSLPIPPDAGWIEFDSSTDLQLVANTKMDLDQTTAFFDAEMAAEGWLSRDAGRHIKEGKGWLPYLRGQQDVLIRLVSLPDGKTRIIVGDAESSSWQLKKPAAERPETEKPGLEAAEFPIPKAAKAVKFELDQKQIEFELAGVTPPALAEKLVDQLQALDWKRNEAGVISDEYVLATISKGKAEIQIRARAEKAKKTTSVIISGDGLLWAKPLPTPPVRLSYETWLRRNHDEATLDRLEEFSAEMHKIPVQPDTR